VESETNESQLRRRLGIPAEAKQVLVFGETSHWDPNWLFTSEEYFKLRIRRILDRALIELEQEPSRVFSVECLFFLKIYWERYPDKRAKLQKLVNEGRLRLTGSAVTTPDTTLPETEAILRDYLNGQQWLRQNGMTQEPRLAYFPDNFGHSPAVPSILRAAGMRYAAITRIDGMNFPATDFRLPSYYPRPGSSAWLLQCELKTLDFVWRGPDGSEVLCHWNPFTYFQGDNLVYLGPVKWMGLLFGIPLRSERHVARRIKKFVRQLSPLSRTPYFFCPIGMDFNAPIKGLLGLLERYNRLRYPDTGIWAALASLNDYLELVSCYADRLPVLALDANPYWMGFYAARPGLKRRCKRLTLDLIRAEKLFQLADPKQIEAAQDVLANLTRAWDTVVVSNHHDFITGTSSDRVFKKEQKSWLLETEKQVESAIWRALPACPTPPLAAGATPPRWALSEGRLEIESAFYRMEIDEKAGGCITRWASGPSGANWLAGPGNDALVYSDSGGLWRMGHEFNGGSFRVRNRANLCTAAISASERNGLLEVQICSMLDKRPLLRRLWFRNDSPIVRMRVNAQVGLRRTITVGFSTGFAPRSLQMGVPGGVVDRPLTKIFEPTFWAAKNFLHVRDSASGRGIAVALYSPASVSADSTGVIQWVALRNAPRERAFWFVPLMSHPASGFDNDEQALDYAVWLTPAGDWRDNKLPLLAEKALRPAWLDPGAPDTDALADSLIETNRDDVVVSAVKTAERGEGIVLRLTSFAPFGTSATIGWRGRAIRRAWLCDALERDLAALEIVEGRTIVSMPFAIASVRLMLA